VADRAEVARDMCFKLWTEERETHEVVDVLGYDTHNPAVVCCHCVCVSAV